MGVGAHWSRWAVYRPHRLYGTGFAPFVRTSFKGLPVTGRVRNRYSSNVEHTARCRSGSRRLRDTPLDIGVGRPGHLNAFTDSSRCSNPVPAKRRRLPFGTGASRSLGLPEHSAQQGSSLTREIQSGYLSVCLPATSHPDFSALAVGFIH